MYIFHLITCIYNVILSLFAKKPSVFVLDFDNSGGPDNIGFVIKKIKIWTDPTAPGYEYDDNLSVEYFLDLHSSNNYDAYCLSYLFTYR